MDVSKIDFTKKLIAFTFDDAPDKQLENILSVFANFNETHPTCPAFASVFCNGNRITDDGAQTLSIAYTMGWELGNHGYSHANFTAIPLEEQLIEIEKTDALLTKIDKKPFHLFRPPYGKFPKESKSFLQTPIISWNIDTLDWADKSIDEIYQSIMQNKKDGDVVLMHDNAPNTVEVLKRLLPDLYESGFQVVSVSMLAKAHNRPLKNGSEYIRVRK